MEILLACLVVFVLLTFVAVALSVKLGGLALLLIVFASVWCGGMWWACRATAGAGEPPRRRAFLIVCWPVTFFAALVGRAQ